MEYHKVTEPSSKIREIARNAAKGNWWKLYLGMLIFMMVTFAVSFLIGLIVYFFPMYRYIFTDNYYYLLNVTGILTVPLVWAIMAPLMLGMYTFLLKAFRSREISYGSIFSGFKVFLKAVGLLLLMAVKILAWSLLFIVPGFIAAYRYSMSMYLLADNHDWKITQCINESKRLMSGNKGKLFCLMFSYLGWYLLWYLFIVVLLFIIAIISVVAFQAMLYDAYFLVGAMFIGLIPVMFITLIPLMSYFFMGQVAFYELVTGNLVVVTQGHQIESGIKDEF